jgi:transcription elongation GreA/GreB family factor
MADRVIRVGSWVEIRDGELEEGWRIVNAEEADAMRRLMSEETPLARALLGHVSGDVVRVRGPQGPARAVTVLDVG